jgi:hypothetical protein
MPDERLSNPPPRAGIDPNVCQRALPALLEPTRPRVREKSLKNFPQSPRRVTFESEERVAETTIRAEEGLDFFGRRFMVLRDWILQNSNSVPCHP